jgi:acetolactate synthase-1/2/3 large subunit
MTIGNIDLKCEIIQVDIEEKNFSPIANMKVKSDISSFLESLNINRKFMISIEKSYGEDTIEYAKAIASFSDAIFTIDIGQHTIWILNAIIAKKPRQIIFSGNMSSMGFSIPAAIGAKLANPNKRVISVVGDGGFQISSSELATIKENNIPIVICLFNNRSLGLIRQIQEIVYGRTFGVDYSDTPDYLKLAEAYGINTTRVSNPKELIEVINKAKEPILIEIPISKEEKIRITKPRILE